MEIEIKYRTIKVPEIIKIDDNVYPNNQRNWDIVREYEETKNEDVLNKLVNFSLDL